MKSFFKFIRATLTGGVLFLLPAVLLIIVLSKAYVILAKISTPLSERLPERVLGFDGSMTLTIMLLILICFLSGLMFRSVWIQKKVDRLEKTFLINIPGYSMIKSITADSLGAKSEELLKPVAIRDGDTWNIGFLVEESEKLCMVFIPDAPKYDAGEMRVVEANNVQKLDIPTKNFIKAIKTFGKGIVQHLD
jgi:uncharacterized membrane protein